MVVDTLRADALGAYACERGLTPRLDRLAEEGVLFQNAFSHAPWTLPSFASLLTSRTPPAHGAGGRLGDLRGLPETIPTLPDRFREAGYATGAIVNVGFLARPFGVTRGFEHLDARAFENNQELRDARATTDAALEWIRGHADGAFLLMVHYFDPHAEYRPPGEFRRRFAADVDREDETFRFGVRSHVSARRAGRLELRPELLERARRLYEAEVAYVDDEIGRLLDGLQDLDLDRTTLVVVTSDHGEEFLDHGDWEHGHTLYDELLRVPLILRQSGRLAPSRIDAAVGHVDLGPTLLSWCGLRACDSFQGRDLVGALAGAQVPPVPLLAFGSFWGPPLSSLREGDLQVIEGAGGRHELYRWTSDPAERTDLAAKERSQAERAQARLETVRGAELRSGSGPGPRASLTAEQSRQLAAVGYVGDADDAKD